MGLYDRDYTQQENDPQQQMRLGLPSITPAVKWLLIINSVIYLVNVLIAGFTNSPFTFLQDFLTVNPTSWHQIAQLWRLITYQFVHWDLQHIFWNMLGLFFLGPLLEQNWGSRKFLTFYLSCGAAGGVFYTLLVMVGFLPAGPMAGASGAILAVLTACAILFPHVVVFFIIVPMPIRVAAILLIIMSAFTILSKGVNAGGEAAHLAGIAAGAFYVLSDSWRTTLKLRFKSSSWERNRKKELRFRIEVDRILKKVHDSGLQSLTPSEKRLLKKATQLEQSRSKF